MLHHRWGLRIQLDKTSSQQRRRKKISGKIEDGAEYLGTNSHKGMDTSQSLVGVDNSKKRWMIM